MTTVLATEVALPICCIYFGFPLHTAQQCQQDSKGTVIIPIAVGVALGFLISVVVLAYVISWFVHRRKSGSYAALN